MKFNLNADTPVSIIGLGAMGAALAKAFIKNGNKTTVWNRSAEKAASLANAGAIQAEAVTDALTASLDQGVDADLLIPFQTLLNRRVAEGYGKDDVAGLFELIKAQT
jgi:glutamyl-tRNA reductase